MFFDKKCSCHKKFQLPLDEFSPLQLGTIRKHMYHTESTQGRETLKTEVKLTHVKKNSRPKPTLIFAPFSTSALLKLPL